MALKQKQPARPGGKDPRSGSDRTPEPSSASEQGEDTTYGVTRTLMTILERVHDATGADILALYPCDGEVGTFSAPVGLGLQPNDLYHAVDDMAEQLSRYRSDSAQGRVPADLRPTHYGISTWLLATHRTFVAADAPLEIGSTFVQRYKIRSTVALPLIVGGQTVALLMVNWSEHATPVGTKTPTEPQMVAEIEALAHDAAPTVTQARAAQEVATFRSLAQLLENLSALEIAGDQSPQPTMPSVDWQRGYESDRVSTFHSYTEEVLECILQATNLEAAALFGRDPAARSASGLVLLAQKGCPEAMVAAPRLKERSLSPSIDDGDAAADADTAEHARHVLVDAGFLAVTTFTLRGRDGDRGLLVVASRDRLAFLYAPEAMHLLLQTAADRIGTTLATSALVETLEETNRTLSALERFGHAIDQPGASQHQVLQAVSAALTDPGLPEFHFDMAVAYLLAHSAHHGTWIRLAAGDTTTQANADLFLGVATPGAREAQPLTRPAQEPRWVSIPERSLDPRDVLSYVATQRCIVVVSARDDEGTESFLAGYPDIQVERLRVPLVRDDGSTMGMIRVAVISEEGTHPLSLTSSLRPPEYTESRSFQLQGDLFEEHGHGRFLRVFVPIGGQISGGTTVAAGVLEAGYTLDQHRQLERTVVEALRHCATQAAAAVEAARLYEETRRHAEHLEIVTEVGRAIASSIDLDQTLRLIARNMARTVDASTCQIALLEDDKSAWYGAAALDQEEQWRRQRVERPQPSLVFEVVDRGKPLVVEDAAHHDLINPDYAPMFGVRSLLILPLLGNEEQPLGAVILGQRDRPRLFTAEEVDRAMGLASQAAVAIENAQVHAREEDDHHIQKDFILIGFGVWGQKAYTHLLTLKQFFNFKTYIVEQDTPARRTALADMEKQVIANGDAIYWDSRQAPAFTALSRDLEASCYVITYVATPAEWHLPVVKKYYNLSDVILIEKPLGAPLEQYRSFLDSIDGHAQIVAADHYYFKLEVLLLQLLLTEERNLRGFLEGVEEIEITLLEEQPLIGTAAEIGIIADMMPHAFAILSLLTPLDRLRLVDDVPLQIGCYQPAAADKETYVRLVGTYPHNGRDVRVIIDTGKGITNSKWIRLVGERPQSGRRSFYKFDFGKGEAVDGTQANLRAAMRPIRQPGVPDNAHLTMLRHVIEKKHPAIGILHIREAMRSNQRIQGLEEMAAKLRAEGACIPYQQGQAPVFPDETYRLH